MEIGPGAAADIHDTGERDIDVGAGEIVDLDQGVAVDPLPGSHVHSRQRAAPHAAANFDGVPAR